MRHAVTFSLIVLSACSSPPEDAACYIPLMTASGVLYAAPFRMVVTNDQRWCSLGIRRAIPGGAAYTEAIISTVPLHGEARAQVSSKGASFLYRPVPGFAGHDEFAVDVGPAGGRHVVSVEVVLLATAAVLPPNDGKPRP